MHTETQTHAHRNTPTFYFFSSPLNLYLPLFSPLTIFSSHSLPLPFPFLLPHSLYHSLSLSLSLSPPPPPLSLSYSYFHSLSQPPLFFSLPPSLILLSRCQDL